MKLAKTATYTQESGRSHRICSPNRMRTMNCRMPRATEVKNTHRARSRSFSRGTAHARTAMPRNHAPIDLLVSGVSVQGHARAVHDGARNSETPATVIADA